MGYKHVEARRAYHRAYMRERRQWYRAHGLCAECGREDAYTMSGHYRCFDCLERRRKTPIEYIPPETDEAPPIPRCQWVDEYGLCYLCGAPLDGGTTAWTDRPRRVCASCYAKLSVTSAKGREAHMAKYGYKYGSLESTQEHGW